MVLYEFKVLLVCFIRFCLTDVSMSILTYGKAKSELFLESIFGVTMVNKFPGKLVRFFNKLIKAAVFYLAKLFLCFTSTKCDRDYYGGFRMC